MVADAFCRDIVHALVRALLPVGEGRRPVSWPARGAPATSGTPAVRVVPRTACPGEVAYPEPELLAARAALTGACASPATGRARIRLGSTRPG